MRKAIRVIVSTIALAAVVLAAVTAHSQKTTRYNLAKLLKKDKLDTSYAEGTMVIKDAMYTGAISLRKVVWLKGVNFHKGTIDVDLRGKDVFLQSFLGVAFHGVDSLTYDAVYFRPFNFKHADTLRRKWSVQYFSLPQFDYDKLRKETPLKYENAVTPVPNPAGWFHATIVVDDNWVTVYVNHSAMPSLKAPMLNTRKDGLLGLWDSSLSGDFANLVVKEE